MEQGGAMSTDTAGVLGRREASRTRSSSSTGPPAEHRDPARGEEGARVDPRSSGSTPWTGFPSIELVAVPESAIDGKRIDEYFRAGFFKTNFWYLFASMFGFEPWHSLIECKRYLWRFFHEAPNITRRSGLEHAVQQPRIDRDADPEMAGEAGGRHQTGVKVTDVDFKPSGTKKTVQRLRHLGTGKTGKSSSARATECSSRSGRRSPIHAPGARTRLQPW